MAWPAKLLLSSENRALALKTLNTTTDRRGTINGHDFFFPVSPHNNLKAFVL